MRTMTGAYDASSDVLEDSTGSEIMEPIEQLERSRQRAG
jgi:hypothetical protein